MQTTRDHIIGLEEYLLKSALELLTQLITQKLRQAFVREVQLGSTQIRFALT